MLKAKNIIKISLILVIFISVISVFVISYIVSKSLSSPERTKIESNPKKEIGLEYDDISFISEGNKIKGWYVPSDKNRFTVVFSHGYQGNRESKSLSAYDVMEDVHKMGGNFLTFDFSAEGESEGKIVTVGYREQEDLKNAIKFAQTKSKAPIFLYGISMGAATTTCVASTSPEGVVGAIADSPFSNLKDYLEVNMSTWSGLPDIPFRPIIMAMEEHIAGVKLDQVDPKGSVKNLKISMMIIHGKGDKTIPYTESIKIANNNKSIDLKIMDNEGHCKSLKHLKNQYLEYFNGFIESNLKNN